MRSRDQCETVVVVESFGNVLSECVSCSSWAYSPSTSVVWVTPQEITHGSFVWHLLNTVESSDVVQGVDTGGQTSVETENLVVNERSQGKVVEKVRETFPDIRISVFAQTLVVETVDLGNLSGLVVSSKNCNALWVADLESDKEGDGLDREITSVDVVACVCQYAGFTMLSALLTHEEIVGVWVWSTNLE